METFCNKPKNKSRHYFVANSLTWFGVHFILYQGIDQIIGDIHFTEVISSSFVIVSMQKSIYYVLDILLGLLLDHSVKNHRIKEYNTC